MLPRFLLLYAAMYAAYGVASPFLPAFVNSRGIAPEELGLVLGTGTAVRLVSAPLAGRLGDLFEALRTVLVLGAAKRQGFEYGRVRGTGSAAFIVATLGAGQAVAAAGLDVIVALQAML